MKLLPTAEFGKVFRRESQDVVVGKFNLITTVAFHFQAVDKAKALIEADKNRSFVVDVFEAGSNQKV